MKELQQYIDRINARRRLFGNSPEITFPLSFEDQQAIEQNLECDWSPENLCCDGEISRSEVDRKRRYLTAVENQLRAA